MVNKEIQIFLCWFPFPQQWRKLFSLKKSICTKCVTSFLLSARPEWNQVVSLWVAAENYWMVNNNEQIPWCQHLRGGVILFRVSSVLNSSFKAFQTVLAWNLAPWRNILFVQKTNSMWVQGPTTLLGFSHISLPTWPGGALYFSFMSFSSLRLCLTAAVGAGPWEHPTALSAAPGLWERLAL